MFNVHILYKYYNINFLKNQITYFIRRPSLFLLDDPPPRAGKDSNLYFLQVQQLRRSVNKPLNYTN